MLETTTVGSLPKPEWLAEPEKLWPTWRVRGEELARAKVRKSLRSQPVRQPITAFWRPYL